SAIDFKNASEKFFRAISFLCLKKLSNPFISLLFIEYWVVLVSCSILSSLLQATKPVANNAAPKILKIVFLNNFIILKMLCSLFFYFFKLWLIVFLLFPAMQQYNLVACLLLVHITFWFLLFILS